MPLIDEGVIEARNFKNSKNKIGYMYMLTPESMRKNCSLFISFLSGKPANTKGVRKNWKFTKAC